jgi:hypothetical protein
VILLVSAVSSPAEYVLVLKSGGQLTVQSYREEGSMIKFQGFGGEIGLSKDQILTIRRAEGAHRLAPPSVALEASGCGDSAATAARSRKTRRR